MSTHPCRIPLIPVQPPPGFRFGSTPGNLSCLVHLDNDRVCCRARHGELIDVLDEGLLIAQVTVVAIIPASDPRADARYVRPQNTPGILYTNGTTANWRAAGWYRNSQGRLELHV